MLLLTSTSDKVRLVTSAAASIDVHASYVDYSAGTITPGRTNTATISTATTTDIVPVPGASTQRNVKHASVRNRHASTSCDVTLIHTDGTNALELIKCTLAPGECLTFNDGIGFVVYSATGASKTTNLSSTPIWARAYHNANQAIVTNTFTNLAFNSERWDTDLIHDNSTNNSRLTCRTAGVYDIDAAVAYDVHATGVRQAFIVLNGGTYIAGYTNLAPNGANHIYFTLSAKYQLAVGDYVEMQVWHSAGVNLNVLAQNNYSPEFAMARIN